jgi:hypothetical protein
MKRALGIVAEGWEESGDRSQEAGSQKPEARGKKVGRVSL